MAKSKTYPGVIAFVVKYGKEYANGAQGWRKKQRQAFFFRDYRRKPDYDWAMSHLKVLLELMIGKIPVVATTACGSRMLSDMDRKVHLRVVAIVPRRKER